MGFHLQRSPDGLFERRQGDVERIEDFGIGPARSEKRPARLDQLDAADLALLIAEQEFLVGIFRLG